MRRGVLMVLGWSLFFGEAMACPVCESELGSQVREGIFGQDFTVNLALTVAPMPFLLGAALLVCRMVSPRGGGERKDA